MTEVGNLNQGRRAWRAGARLMLAAAVASLLLTTTQDPVDAVAAGVSGVAEELPSRGMLERDDRERVDLWAKKHAPGSYGGVWQKSGETVAAFTTEPSVHANALKHILQRPDRLRVVRVDQSLQEMRSLVDAVTADMSMLRAAGVEVTGAGVQLQSNSVVISVLHLTDAVSGRLKERYGQDVLVEEEAYASFMANRSDGPPWMGGIEIQGLCESNDCLVASGCTSAFPVMQTLNAIRYYSMLTAGHCFVYGTEVTNANFIPLGRVTQQYWNEGIRSDVEKISLTIGTQTDHILPQNGGPRREIADLRLVQDDSDGVCKAGVTTDLTCGWDVWLTHATRFVCAEYGPDGECILIYTLIDHVVALRSSPGLDEGDSGGPVFTTFADGRINAHGIVSAGNAEGTRMVYSFLPNALDDTGTLLCGAEFDCDVLFY